MPVARRPLNTNTRGFTAVELMVTVAILAILATIAAPNFSHLIERWRVRNVSEDFQSTLYFARSEAIKRGGGVQMTPDGNWDDGWKITDADGTTLREIAAPSRVTVDGLANPIEFNRWGIVNPPQPSFTFYPQGKNASDPATHKLCMSVGGRIRIVAGSTC